ncbi:uncharacterized protein LOC116183038 [Photinus pyralis]|uniref:uncharacterized protein LOC116183038 n=1 Tax=Photinus pyralis TaxID=7054 RepID=UPI0012671CB8|nr:uncharacterized protein LOC116183038 [Photinus pyralis]
MKKRSYQVEINLDRDGSIQIENINCQCARGQFKCHHIAAILLYSHKNFSKTDKMCQWKAPSSSGPENVVSVKDLFPKPQHRSTNRNVDTADKEFFYCQLKSLNRFSGFCWLLSPEQKTLHTEVKSFSKILELSKIVNGEIDEIRLFTNFQVTEKEIVQVAATTCGQNENPTWHQMRLGRLTATNLHLFRNVSITMESADGEHIVGDCDRGSRKRQANLTSRERKKQCGQVGRDDILKLREVFYKNPNKVIQDGILASNIELDIPKRKRARKSDGKPHSLSAKYHVPIYQSTKSTNLSKVCNGCIQRLSKETKHNLQETPGWGGNYL